MMKKLLNITEVDTLSKSADSKHQIQIQIQIFIVHSHLRCRFQNLIVQIEDLNKDYRKI